MSKYFVIFIILAACLFALMLTMSGCDGERIQQLLPPSVEAPGTEPPTEPPEGMVLIPAGTFQMGSNDEEARDDEQPVHTVHLDAFYMDKYEVTNAQFKAFLDANPAWQKDNIDDRFHDGFYLTHWTGTDSPAEEADSPVVYVTWYAAMAYAEWAGKRLPTEAE